MGHVTPIPLELKTKTTNGFSTRSLAVSLHGKSGFPHFPYIASAFQLRGLSVQFAEPSFVSYNQSVHGKLSLSLSLSLPLSLSHLSFFFFSFSFLDSYCFSRKINQSFLLHFSVVFFLHPNAVLWKEMDAFLSPLFTEQFFFTLFYSLFSRFSSKIETSLVDLFTEVAIVWFGRIELGF